VRADGDDGGPGERRRHLELRGASGRDHEHQQVVFQPELVVRASTRG
jgi:hypothetical protein